MLGSPLAPTPSWGGMLGEGKDCMLLCWWLATFPGLAIFVTTLLINLVVYGLRDWLDPARKVRGSVDGTSSSNLY